MALLPEHPDAMTLVQAILSLKGQGAPASSSRPAKVRKVKRGKVKPIDETAQSLYDAGFRGKALRNMIAIAGRESHYNHKAHNATYPDDSYGDVQINVLPGANPRFKHWNLTDPEVNAKAAKILYDQAGYKPWVGVGYGNARSYLPAARKAVRRIRR